MELSYSVTADTLPTFTECTDVPYSGRCTLSINWLRNPVRSQIQVSSDNLIPPIGGEALVMATHFDLNNDNSSSDLSHQIHYECTTSDKCNNIDTLKRLLNSITLSERFAEELKSLLVPVIPFTNDSAAECYPFSNVTDPDECDQVDIDRCHRCSIHLENSESEHDEICATCVADWLNTNEIAHSIGFLLENRSHSREAVKLTCQKAGQCNSIINLNKIRQASNISFDFDKYFSTPSSVATVVSLKSLMNLLTIIIIFLHC